MTLKEIRRIASGDFFMIRLQRINNLESNLVNMTENERSKAEIEIKIIAKEIQYALSK